MPYIKNREKFDVILGWFKTRPDLNNLSAGEINYLITKIINRQLGDEPHYDDFNKIIGILECVNYENKKIKENGDVYGEKN